MFYFVFVDFLRYFFMRNACSTKLTTKHLEIRTVRYFENCLHTKLQPKKSRLDYLIFYSSLVQLIQTFQGLI